MILGRVLWGVLTLWVVSILVFAATFAIPGDAATAILGREATPERLTALRARLHLNDSAIAQYWHWLRGIIRFDPGTSVNGREVTELVSTRISNSLWLMVIAGSVAIPIAIALGVWMAVRRDRVVDHVGSTATLVLAALPSFVIGVGVVSLLATQAFHLFPAVSLLRPGGSVWDKPDVMVLPSITLALVVIPYVSRIMRGSMVEVMESDYVTNARLKGLPERRVVWRHAVPNAIAPAIQAIALALAYMAGGIVIIEYVFGFPGVGSILVDSVRIKDLPVVQTLVMLVACLYVLLNLAADVSTILVTPKMRTLARS